MSIDAEIKIEIYKVDGLEPEQARYLSLHPVVDSKEQVILESGSFSYVVSIEELRAAVKAIEGLAETQ